jgi:hypothetical protein
MKMWLGPKALLLVVVTFAPFVCRAAAKSTALLDTPLQVVSIEGAEGVILPVAIAGQILDQCSRTTLGKCEGYWLPTLKDIEPIEKNLSAYVKAHPDKGYPNQWKQLDKFRRQYAGLIRNGKKTIYVNLFPKRDDPKLYWRKGVAGACDGGPSYFGVEFDTEAGEFIHIAYNGVA